MQRRTPHRNADIAKHDREALPRRHRAVRGCHRASQRHGRVHRLDAAARVAQHRQRDARQHVVAAVATGDRGWEGVVDELDRGAVRADRVDDGRGYRRQRAGRRCEVDVGEESRVGERAVAGALGELRFQQTR